MNQPDLFGHVTKPLVSLEEFNYLVQGRAGMMADEEGGGTVGDEWEQAAREDVMQHVEVG